MQATTPETPSPVLHAVIDTNVLLDWLVFRDPETQPLADAICAGRIRWLATQAMRDEMQRVLSYDAISAWQPDARHIDLAWTRHATLLEPPARGSLHCGDPDDQKFIDLALGSRAKWLFTKDRELLKLAKRAQTWGVSVLPTAAWNRAASQQ